MPAHGVELDISTLPLELDISRSPSIVTKSAELLSSQGLGENVYNLLLCADVDQVDVSSQNLLSNKVVMELYVFGPRMKH